MVAQVAQQIKFGSGAAKSACEAAFPLRAAFSVLRTFAFSLLPRPLRGLAAHR
jgi:hypothetical protein